MTVFGLQTTPWPLNQPLIRGGRAFFSVFFVIPGPRIRAIFWPPERPFFGLRGPPFFGPREVIFWPDPGSKKRGFFRVSGDPQIWGQGPRAGGGARAGGVGLSGDPWMGPWLGVVGGPDQGSAGPWGPMARMGGS